MAKDLKIGILNQIYGKLLTENQRTVAAYYYDDDLSLGEIAENLGVTRQAVHDTLVKAEGALNSLEEVLGIYARGRKIADAVAALRRLTDERAQKLLDEISDLI